MFTKTAQFYDAIYHWKDYEAEGLDLDANLLAIARERLPGLAFQKAKLDASLHTQNITGRNLFVATKPFSSA